jgi:hypothetical protein
MAMSLRGPLLKEEKAPERRGKAANARQTRGKERRAHAKRLAPTHRQANRQAQGLLHYGTRLGTKFKFWSTAMKG